MPDKPMAELAPPRAKEVLPRHSVATPVVDTITLPYEQRHRRRIVLASDSGIDFLLDLAETTLLKNGDVLVLEDGRAIDIRAAAEPLLEVRGKDAAHLLKLAWHLGNRHLEAQIDKDRILIRRDHVIADMLERLGAAIREVEVPFNPEGGAYGGHRHSHGSHHHGQ